MTPLCQQTSCQHMDIRQKAQQKKPTKKKKTTQKKYAQELLSTFPSLGEVALQPGSSGTFIISLTTSCDGASHDSTPPAPASTPPETTSPTLNPPRPPQTCTTTVLWDRRRDSGFPETKLLKRLVRDVVDPSRALGHIDGLPSVPRPAPACEDC
ncbi:hypothetical protein CDD82_1423 [Ophiocordyceps australis]|uniref:Uncharacterized protein n=1 Tax=Ophiocordyceps australis TaxID=1399860 RepID=A0A2C5YIG1_9HYPO|nr:hypothetical protein CDD82_1423 [Ophiocordyceps australis]